MTPPVSALYVGKVVHTRVKPRRHRLGYRCYWTLVDLDELPALDRRLRLFSADRFNLFSLANSDHGGDDTTSPREEVRRHLAAAGFNLAGGRILLLTMPRVLGYAFNPLSVYFCYGRDGSLVTIVYEVHNTFAQRHSYMLAVEKPGETVSQRCAKRFYVSPFLDMELGYEFTVAPPGEDVRVAIRVSDRDGPVLSAWLAGRRRPLNDAGLLRVFFTHPLLTAKVIAAIHWEALRLWWKGVALVPRPAPPSRPTTVPATAGDHR